MKRFVSATIISFLLSGSAFAELSLTPRVGHNYIKFDTEVKYNISNEPDVGPDRSTNYSNSVRYDLELAYTTDQSLEWIVDLGYSQLPSPSEKAGMMNLDLATRMFISDLYFQLGLGMQQFIFDGTDGDPSFTLTVPNVGIGVGYVLPLSSTLKLDFFYRGQLSLAASSYEKSEEYSLGFASSRITSLENHQVGMGVRFSF
jgi:hypothetical protein